MKPLILSVVGSALLAACAATPSPTALNAPARSEQESADFEKDREAILAMAGIFKVRFDFIETAALSAGYEPKDRKVSGGYEIVKVIEDRGDFISLQHILYVGGDEKFALKHWRQDWQYEPEDVLTFIGGNAWEMRPVSRAERKGAWSQEVYQVDDSPRYGAVAAWRYDNGIPAWEPDEAWRPLPRRDMVSRDDYHVVEAVNRHAITPRGWIHEQDNTKIVLGSDEPKALVREIAINTYYRTDEVGDGDVEAYWQATDAYWKGVRDRWEALERTGAPFALTLKGEPADLYTPLLELGSKVEAGELTSEAAIEEADAVIARYTTSDLPPLQARLR
jgi:hypothetical protein